jgi:phosphocarrier protein HPr
LNKQAHGRFEIVNERGLHARAATKLVTLASSFKCDIMLSAPEVPAVSAKSIMGVLLLCGIKGTIVEVEARGEHAKQAVDAIGALIERGFEESR